MKDIRLYDFEFNLLHIEHRIISANWTLKYNGIGSFEGHFDPDSAIVAIALNNPYIVAVQGDYQAIITSKQISKTDFVLYGKTVNWILSRRVMPNFVSGDFESLKITDEAVKIASEAFDDVDNFEIGSVPDCAEESYFWRNTYNPTSEVIADCLDNAALGHNVVFDVKGKRWVFNILQGEEKPLIISAVNRNAYETEYAEDLQEYYTEGWYEKAQSADEDGNVPDSEWVRIAKDDKSGIYRWECVLNDDEESDARASLKKKAWDKEITTQTRSLICGRDYELGDIFRVQIIRGKYKKTEKKRVTGVSAWFENNNIGEEPIFEE